jgi:hypothetical protein
MSANDLLYFWDYTLRDSLKPLADLLRIIAQHVTAYFEPLHPLIKAVTYLLMLLVVIGILMSHFLGIYRNRKEWKEHPQSGLTFSYFCGTGALQRRLSYKEAHKLLRDRRWSWISFAGLAFRLGNFTHDSILLMFVCSLFYIPLAILGFFEMTLRIIAGTIWLLTASLIQRFILFVLCIASYIFIPLWQIADKSGRIDQHCPHCYETFNLPAFKCPGCGKAHKQVIPSRSGILVARCECGCFFPSSLYTGRSNIQAICPSCEKELFAANARQFSIQLVGGNSSGKTAIITAFQHLYLNNSNSANHFEIVGEPQNYFDDLEQMYRTGSTEPSSSSAVSAYSFIHKLKRSVRNNLVIFDIPDEVILSGTYERNPRNLGFSDGIIFIIDPLSIPSVREECIKTGDKHAVDKYSDDDINELIIEFVHQFSSITGRASRRQNSIPVAIVINKVDIKAVKREIGMPKIRVLYEADPSAYNNNISVARDEVCRAYLSKLGLDNTLNNLDGTFSNIRYFPVSAIGHLVEEGKEFAPLGILAPFTWITKEANSILFRILDNSQKETEK